MSKKKKKATAPKIQTPLPAKSAWARGPPQSSPTAPSPSSPSQSPASFTPVLQSHSRRPRALSLGIPIKDGVIIPQSNVGAVKQGSAITFGSIDDVSSPISSSPAALPPTKSEGVLETVAVATAHVNGKPSIPSKSSLVPPKASTSTAPPVKPKIDIKKMFQGPSSAPSSNSPSDTLSPSMQNVSLPTQQQQLYQGQSSHTPLDSSQPAHSFTPFVPSNTMRPPQSIDPNGGPPKSPQYPWQMLNDNGPHSQDGQNGDPPAGLSSPRLASQPHNSQTSTTPPPPPPQMLPQMQPMWYYYQYPPSNQPHFMPYQQWYNPMQMPPQHQPPPHQPHPGSQMPHTGLPISPRNSPTALEGPSTPTLSEQEQNDRLKVEAADKEEEEEEEGKPEAERKKKKKKKKAKASEEICNLEVAARLEKEQKELCQKQEKERLRKEAEALELQRLAEAERKAKVAEEIRNLELAARLEKEQKEQRRKREEERLQKEAEALELQRLKEEERRLRLKQYEERILKAKQEEKALRLAQERAKDEKERKEKGEREEQERLSKLAEETRLRLEEEAAAKAKAEEREEAELEIHKGDGKQDGQPEDGRVVDTKTSKSVEGGKDKPKDGLRINTTSISFPTSDKRRLGPLDLTSVITSASPFVAALATARVITDIATVSYPEGCRGPHPHLNQNVKNGKFRYDREFLLQFMSVCKERPAALPPLDAIGLEPVDHTEAMSRGRTGHHRPSSAVSPSRQASVGLGFTPSALGKSGANNLFSMGNFATIGAGSKLTSKDRYTNSNRTASVSGTPGMQYTSPQMHQPMGHYVRGVSGQSVKDIAAPAGNVTPASANIDRLTDIMVSHLVEDPATTSRNRAISLLQEQEDGLTTDQKVAMISCFMENVVAADTYILLTAPELRQSWIHMMLMKRPM